ncbi:MAG: transposase [Thermodesulfobacteriota bacterium]
MQYRRSRATGATFFFTVVTHKRRKLLCLDLNVGLLRDAFRYVMDRHVFSIDAFVLLPDHLHCIWALPENDNDFSTRWRLIKSYFTRKYRNLSKANLATNRMEKSQQTVGRVEPCETRHTILNNSVQAVWQNRFWEHQIRDDLDLIRHVEYIHYNPVKHGFVPSPQAWPYSSFHRYVKEGTYQSDWGAGTEIDFDREIGSE